MDHTTISQNDRLLDEDAVVRMSNLSRSTIRREELFGRFPERQSTSFNLVRWSNNEIQRWIVVCRASRPGMSELLSATCLDIDDRVLSIDEVAHLVSMSKSTISRLERAGLFPLRFRISRNRKGWSWYEVNEWIVNRRASRQAARKSKALNEALKKIEEAPL